MMLMMLTSMMIFKVMILSTIMLMFMMLSFKLLSMMMPTPFLVRFLREYQSLNPKLSISLAFSATHLVSWMHSMFIFLWIMMSINFINLPVSELML